MNQFIINARFNKKERTIVARVGGRYVVDPMNDQKKRDRGRIGVIEGFDNNFRPEAALLRCEDNNRIAKVDITDLVACPLVPEDATDASNPSN